MKKSAFGYLLLLPALAVILALNIFPIGYSVFLSLNTTTLSGHQTFVGLKNFAEILKNPTFVNSIGLSFEYAAVATSLGTGIGLALALVCNAQYPGRGIVRNLLVIPISLPLVIVGLLWGFMYDYNFGFLNNFFEDIRVMTSSQKIFWLAPNTALFYVAVAQAWAFSAFTALLILASLQNVDPAQYEAAELDGAGAGSRFWHITLPHIRTILDLTILLNILTAIGVVDIVYVMTYGGPETATTTMPMFAYQQFFLALQFGPGAAAAIMMALVASVAGTLYVILSYRRRIIS